MKRKNSFKISAKSVMGLVVLFAFAVGGLIWFLSAEADENIAQSSSLPVVFSEIMVSNGSTVKAPDGDFYDYFELHNTSDKEVSLTNCTVLEPDGQTAYVFPSNTVIEPDGYLVVWCGKDKSDSLYADFRLNKAGNQTLTLRDSSSSVVDTVTTSATESGSVLIVDGEDVTVSATPTPGFANTEEGRMLYLQSLQESEQKDIVISEIMTQNHTVLADEDGDYCDFIELHNTSDRDIDLKGYTLTDDANDLYAWTFEDTVLPANGYILIYASGKDRTSGTLHTDFKLSYTGETVTLCDKSGHICATVTCPELEPGQSYELLENGYCKTYSPTPGFANTDDGRNALAVAEDSKKTELVIWEAMSKNNSILPMNGAKYYDWVEIKNISDHTVDLSEYYLSDDADNMSLWQLPSKTLKPGETALYICSGETGLTNSQYTHTSFKINNEEEIFLCKDGKVIDALCLKATQIGESMGRTEGKNGFFYLTVPTPGQTNKEEGATRSVVSAPVFSVQSGVYDGIESLQIFLDAPADIYYKLYYSSDGGKTSSQSEKTKYDPEVGITLTSTAVIRAYSCESGRHDSDVVYASYIINENHTLDVMSVTLAYEDMWSSKTGIYAYGYNDEGDADHTGANFWESWEREAQADLYCKDGSEGFSIPCGIKIFGSYSRKLDKKSFQLKFRNIYGAGELVYNVFDNDVCSFEALVLRSGSQDYNGAMVRDEWLTSLAALGGLDLYVQSYRPVILYVNGAYFGIYFIREKMGADYVSKHTNVSAESVNLVEANHRTVEGSNEEYVELLEYVGTHDLSNTECYEYVCSKIDLDSYIDYKISEFFSGNQDTGNIRFFMTKEGDGKWHWIYYDLDYAFYYYTKLYQYTTRVRSGFTEVNVISAGLVKNADFRDKFLRRCAELFTTVYSYDNATSVLDDLTAVIAPEMERNCERWGIKYSNWSSVLQGLKDDILVKLAQKTYYYKKDGTENGYSWSLYAMIKEEFNLSDNQMKEYFGDVNY